MLKKYHLTISVTFWTLITAIIVLFTLSALLPDFKLPGLLTGIFQKTNIEKEPAKLPEKEKVYIAQTQYLEIEKKIEWFYFVATGYSADDDSQGTGQKTSTGKNVFEGVIAVDPKIIPYGTKIEIKDKGFFVAEDCGSKIKGNRIDIYFNSKAEAREFGKQGVWIRFVGDNQVEIAQITKNKLQSIK
jgi:3D (Asp-Asp-Asp) domain-containing protein